MMRSDDFGRQWTARQRRWTGLRYRAGAEALVAHAEVMLRACRIRDHLYSVWKGISHEQWPTPPHPAAGEAHVRLAGCTVPVRYRTRNCAPRTSVRPSYQGVLLLVERARPNLRNALQEALGLPGPSKLGDNVRLSAQQHCVTVVRGIELTLGDRERCIVIALCLVQPTLLRAGGCASAERPRDGRML